MMSYEAWLEQQEEQFGFHECGEQRAMREEAERELAMEAGMAEAEARAAEEEDRRRYPGGRCFREPETYRGKEVGWWAGPRCETMAESEVPF